MAFRIILCRHSQAIHNEQKQAVRRYSENQTSYKSCEKYKELKFNKELIDHQEINMYQVMACSQHLKKQEIGLVIVSPLDRCIETALAFKFDSKTVRVVVEPLICSRVASSWSIGYSIEKKIKKYPQLDFSFCRKENITWCVDLLIEKTPQFKHFYNDSKGKEEPEQLILEYIKTGGSESYLSVIERAEAFKKRLKEEYLKLTDKNILIISHSNFLKALTARYVDEKGKARSDLVFNHSDLLYCKEEFLTERKLQNFVSEAQKMQKEQESVKEPKQEYKRVQSYGV